MDIHAFSIIVVEQSTRMQFEVSKYRLLETINAAIQ